MNQRGPGTTTPVTMDQMSYTYKGNQLTRVEDAQTVNYGDGDFQNGNSGSDDYKYDANGNLTSDANKGITAVTYTYFNKPQTITLNGGKTILNSYDASGSKVEEKVTDPGKPTIVRDYVGNYVYENNILKYLLTAEGRSVYDKSTNTFKDEYFVKDHLGNIRSVVDVHNYPIQQYLATYEIASANLENLFFDNVDGVRDDRPGSTWNGDLKSARLNGGDPERRTGTSLLLKVMAGDKIELNVNNYYDQYNASDDQPVSMEDMLGSVVGVLTGGQGGSLPGEGHDTKLVTDVFNMPNYGLFDEMVNQNADQSKPKAYLNYLMFNERMELVPEMSGAFQANGNGTWAQIGTTAPLVVPANGYLAVYLSNRSAMSCGTCGDVFFDQLVVRVSYGVLKEESHYYPHGLPMRNMGSTAAGFEPNRRKYQSNEYIQDIGLNWMDFQNRQYDPQIGRFLGVDPLAEETDMMSPYTAMNNDPVSTVDPLGLQGFNTMERQGALDNKINPFAEFYSRFSPGTLKAWGMGAPKEWGDGGSGGQITLYGTQAQALFLRLFGDGESATPDGNIALPEIHVFDHRAGYTAWEKDMIAAGFGDLLGPGFHDFAFSQSMRDPYFRADYYGYSPKQVGIHDAFDGLGLIPVGGEIFDGANAAIYSLEGDYKNAAISSAAMIPFIGWGAVGLKGYKAYKITKALVPLGLGSTGRTAAKNLVEQMAMKEILANPHLGTRIMEGMKDARWPGWTKMEYKIKTSEGVNAVIHYMGEWNSGVLKAVDDFKFK
jgi:RHS repeat-associated protein